MNELFVTPDSKASAREIEERKEKAWKVVGVVMLLKAGEGLY